MPLSISELEPLRKTMAFSGLAERPSVFLMPLPSICADANTKTTSARPKAAATLLVLRTMRFRTLYLMGIISRSSAAHR